MPHSETPDYPATTLMVLGTAWLWNATPRQLGRRADRFLLVGGFLVLAGLHSNPQEAQGLGGALARLQEQAHGWLLLSVTAAGLAAYGLFAFGEAFYRRIRPPDLKSKLKATG